jgi:hypothetical protein
VLDTGSPVAMIHKYNIEGVLHQQYHDLYQLSLPILVDTDYFSHLITKTTQVDENIERNHRTVRYYRLVNSVFGDGGIERRRKSLLDLNWLIDIKFLHRNTVRKIHKLQATKKIVLGQHEQMLHKKEKSGSI